MVLIPLKHLSWSASSPTTWNDLLFMPTSIKIELSLKILNNNCNKYDICQFWNKNWIEKKDALKKELLKPFKTFT